ncbi:MAG: YitT family protein [Candidatus Coproplasma sp.]
MNTVLKSTKEIMNMEDNQSLKESRQTENVLEASDKKDGDETLAQEGENTPDSQSPSNAKPPKEPLTKKRVLSIILNFLLMNLGTLLVAGGVYFFKVPNNFATGGVSGISIIFARLFGKYAPNILTQANLNMAINLLLLVVGFIFLGKGCTLKTVYCSLVYSAENMLFEYFLPFKKDTAGNLIPLTNQPFLELVYAMLLTGIGSAIIFNCRASSGGTDIIALILKKYTKLDTGKALLVVDFAIAFSTFFVTGNITVGLYSLLGLFAKAFIIDSVIESIGKSKYITIITTKPDEIGKYITDIMKRDYTKYVATGGYTGNQKTVMITVCKRGEALKLKTKVKQIDPSAFTIFTDANEILGKGFRGSL